MTEFEKKQLRWTRITAIFTVLIFLTMLIAAVGIISFEQEMQHVMDTLSEVSRQLSTVDWAGVADAMDAVSTQLQSSQIEEIIEKLNTVSGSLAQVDFVGLSEDIDTLATAAQTSLTEAMEAIDELDIEGLNAAIHDLQTIIEPLAKLFNRG